MRPQYITIAAGVPKVVALDTNITGFDTAVRTDATTVEVTLEDPADPASVSPNNGSLGQTWVPAPAAGANGIILLQDPYRAIRFSKATPGTATILQQGIT